MEDPSSNGSRPQPTQPDAATEPQASDQPPAHTDTSAADDAPPLIESNGPPTSTDASPASAAEPVAVTIVAGPGLTSTDLSKNLAAALSKALNTPASQPQSTLWPEMRTENVGSDELTVEEVEALFAAQQPQKPSNKPMGSTAVMDENDMDRLLKSLGEDSVSTSQYAWLPSWAHDPKPKSGAGAKQPPRYTADDVYATTDDVYGDETSDEKLVEVRQIVRDLEVTAATIDDTTVATRDAVKDLAEEVRTAQTQIGNVEEDMATMKAQNAALTEEVRELRHAVVTMRSHVATLIRLLAGESQARPAAIVPPQANAAPVAQTEPQAPVSPATGSTDSK